MTGSGRRALACMLLVLASLTACEYITDPSPEPSTTLPEVSPTDVEPSSTTPSDDPSDDLQVRIDVLDGDGTSVLGSRLFVVASEDDGTFTVTKVTATQLCARGVSGTGGCR